MPRYAYQKPRARVYSYNLSYMSNYYKPMTHYLGQDVRADSEQPGHQSLAERLKKFPMDGSVYRERASSAPPRAKYPALEEEKPKAIEPAPSPKSDALALVPVSDAPSKNSPLSLTLKEELRRLPPVGSLHPWDWDCLWIPPHETRVTPHFGLASYNELMLRFLRLKPYRYMALDNLIFKDIEESKMTHIDSIKQCDMCLKSSGMTLKAIEA